MIPITDFEKRSNEGQLMTANEFDDFLMETASELVDKYDLVFDESQIIADDERADAVFNAAVEFLATVGVYNRTTSHAIKWTEDEIREMAADYKNNPRKLTIGAGKEQLTIEARKAGDGKTPVILAGGGPLFNAAFIGPAIMAYTKEPSVKGFTKCGCIAKIGDVAAQANSPSEIFVQVEETKAQLAALEKAGRQGMFLGNVNSTDPISAAMCVRPGLYEPSQCMIGVHIAPEQKIDNSRLKASYICEELGVSPWASAMSMMGGLAGGPGGTAMCLTANLLAQLSYAHSPWSSVSVTDMKGSSKTAKTLMTLSAALRAAERNLNLVTGVPCTDATVCTCFEEGLLGGAVIAATTAASGAAINWLTGTSPLSARIQNALMEGIVGKSREEANAIVVGILKAIDDLQKEHAGVQLPLPAQLFFSVYDISTLSPKPEYKAAAENAVALMRKAGAPISDALSLD